MIGGCSKVCYRSQQLTSKRSEDNFRSVVEDSLRKKGFKYWIMQEWCMQSKNVYVLEDSYSDDFTPQKSRWWKDQKSCYNHTLTEKWNVWVYFVKEDHIIIYLILMWCIWKMRQISTLKNVQTRNKKEEKAKQMKEN